MKESIVHVSTQYTVNIILDYAKNHETMSNYIKVTLASLTIYDYLRIKYNKQ